MQKKVKNKVSIIGRKQECALISATLSLHRNLLIEGPVGVGKTYLVQMILQSKGIEYVRIDGDTRYSEQKLTGWFDPPIVLKKGYTKDCFIEGPLVSAMKQGSVLFINELNRMPEAVQNILLPAMDERKIILPKLGEVEAKAGFLVIATQNPREFTATHALSEALLDRFELLKLDYQSREEELGIMKVELNLKEKELEKIIDITRSTRNHPKIKRGASIRAALAIGKLLESGLTLEEAALLALPNRIELLSLDDNLDELIQALLNQTSFPQIEKKK